MAPDHSTDRPRSRLLHERALKCRSSKRAEYVVTPATPDSVRGAEVVLTIEDAGLLFRMQDTLTPDEADALGDALKAAAAITRELDEEAS